MGQKRGRGRPKVAEPDPQAVAEEPAPDAALSESQLARIRLRQRWELASVLNFLTVFKEKVGTDSKITAEEIETGLITPNGDLAQIHISLLKGIPPTNKNMRENDAWVTIVCKKLANWWPWVAEGEIPLEADHGEEITKYKELDPTTRLLILKALCELRALQDDIMKYVADGLKNGTPISTFRKERIGGGDNGSIYWYDGDPVVGYRLYKEITGIDSKHKLKGKGRQAQLAVEPQWETLATNLEEFCEISENLSSSKNKTEAAVGEIVKTDIIPVLENLQKKKERALKRQQTQATLLDGFLYSNGRQTRERKPVKYTFDEYDRAIDEAIHISKKPKTTASGKNTNKVGKHVANEATAKDSDKDSDKENSNPVEDHGSPAEVGDKEGATDNGKNEGTMSDHDDEGNTNSIGKNEDRDDSNDEKNEDRDSNGNVEEDDDGDGSNREEEDDKDGSNYDDKDDDRDGSNYEDDDSGEEDENSNAGDDSDRNSSVSDESDGNYSMGDSDEDRRSRAVRVRKDAKAKKTVNLRRSRNRNNTEGNGHGEAKKRLRQRPTRNIDYNDESDSDSEDDDFVSSDGDED